MHIYTAADPLGSCTNPQSITLDSKSEENEVFFHDVDTCSSKDHNQGSLWALQGPDYSFYLNPSRSTRIITVETQSTATGESFDVRACTCVCARQVVITFACEQGGGLNTKTRGLNIYHRLIFRHTFKNCASANLASCFSALSLTTDVPHCQQAVHNEP